MFALLEHLMSKPGQILSAEQLTIMVWSHDADISPDTLRSHLRSLRKKLGESEGNSLIKNVHGVGYKVEA